MLSTPPLSPQAVLCRCITDLRILERYLIEAFELQQHEKELKAHPDASRLVIDTLDILRYHVARLDEEIEVLDTDPRAALKRAAASISGAFVTSVSKLRSHDASKILRDDHTMLNLACVGYTMLHTTAIALGNAHLAQFALVHLRELTGIVLEINQLVPRIVIQELSRNFTELTPGAADLAWHNVEEAWGREVRSVAATG